MAKETCATCAAQIVRLAAKPFYGTKGEGIVELIATLHRYGHDKAEIVIDEALIRRWGANGEDAVPSPSDIWGLCKENPADFQSREQPAEASRVNPGCPTCSGTGWQVIRRGSAEGVLRCPDGCEIPAHRSDQGWAA